MRIIIFTGAMDGYRTEVAKTKATQYAKKGYKTLLISRTPYHTLSSLVGERLVTPTHIDDRLWGLELYDVNKRNKNWNVVENWLLRNMLWEDLKLISTEEISVIPGIKEAVDLMELNQYIGSQNYDVILLDYKPMEEVLRILSYPELFKYWYERQYNNQHHLLKFVRPFAKVVSGGFELPDDEVMGSIESLLKQFIKLQKTILDRSLTTFRFIATSDSLKLKELRREFTYYNMMNFLVDGVISDVHSVEIEESFSPLPILTPLDDEDLDILYSKQVLQVKSKQLKIHIPSINELHVYQKFDELILEGNDYKRLVFLPKLLSSKKVVNYEINDHYATVYFE